MSLKSLVAICLSIICALAMRAASGDDGQPAELSPGGMAGHTAGQLRDDNLLKTKLVWIPAGHFTMGSPQDEADHRENEGQVEVRITTGFWMGQHEVTQPEWSRVMRTTPWRGRNAVKEGDCYPATFVSWDDAVKFCERLTGAERRAGRLPAGWKYSLPTEAQWEYACRAGTTTPFSFGRDAAGLIDHGWFDLNTTNAGTRPASPRVRQRPVSAERYAHEVARKKPNPWGLYDMHGNVFEWCRDGSATTLPGGDDPFVEAAGTDRVVRGGSWVLGATFCRSSRRDWDFPDDRTSSLGFRLALVHFAK
jgi:formylglycine-generating enzyme required for sulfatase activity